MDTNEVRTWITFACERNQIFNFAHKVNLKRSNRMTRSMGFAKTDGKGTYSITLSNKLFERATKQQQIETVVHETCHIIDAKLTHKRMSHGDVWKKCMRLCGFEPRTYHDVDTTGLNKRWHYTCDCRDFEISTRMHNQIEKGRRRVCNRCKSYLRKV